MQKVKRKLHLHTFKLAIFYYDIKYVFFLSAVYFLLRRINGINGYFLSFTEVLFWSYIYIIAYQEVLLR